MLYLLESPSVPTTIPNYVPIRKSFLMPLMVLLDVNKLNLPAKIKSGSVVFLTLSDTYVNVQSGFFSHSHTLRIFETSCGLG
jgi:hypothetical protein